jgi:hypothetical protein
MWNLNFGHGRRELGGAAAIQLEARLRHDLRLERGRGERDAAALEHALSDLMES